MRSRNNFSSISCPLYIPPRFHYIQWHILPAEAKSLFFVFLFIPILSFAAEYKPIPIEKSQQYKYEIEQIINQEVPEAIKKVDRIYKKAKEAHKIAKEQPGNLSLAENLYSCERIIGEPEFYLYIKLIDVTNKYVQIKDDIPPTGFAGTLYDFLYPYFKNNNINLTTLDKLVNYVGIKHTEIQKMCVDLQKE